jgi:signal transduction histidine kinase
LQINYASPTFLIPQKVKFRYRLDGYEHDWHDAGTRRQAFYTDLPPGNYSFSVIACNSDGVWSDSPTTFHFSVTPALYQTTWFRLLLVVLFLALLWVAYQLRVRQIATQFNRTFEARVSERTRIARELHDTLLQSFQGLLLRFQSASKLLPARPDEAKHRLDAAIEQGAEAIAEGRDAVQGLRSSAFETNDLANAITAFAEELSREMSTSDCPVIEVEVEGAARNLQPMVRDETYRIAAEALRNAFRHAQAQRITVEIRYDKRQFRLRIRDDGKGIKPDSMQQQPTGHFGLPGMRERAEIVGGKLEVWSQLDAGTQVELSIPGSIAYDVSARQSE